jgi:predicted N-acetyltransferase YhbS
MTEFRIDHLFNRPQHIEKVAALIHREFWSDRPGFSPATFERLLKDATVLDRIPLCLVAFAGDALAGTVSLIENDDAQRRHLRPWLAALIVLPEFRGKGLGTKLVRRTIEEARRLGFATVHLGTSTPEFYARLGARPLEWARPDLLVMSMSTGTPAPVSALDSPTSI